MSRRKQLIVRTALACTVPVLALGTWIVWRDRGDRETYVAGEAIEGITQKLDRSAEEDASPLRFTDVADEAGLDFAHFPYRRTSQLPEDMGSGLAWGDYDGDDWPDLFLVNFSPPLGVAPGEMPAITDRLYRNRGDGTFEDVTEAAGVGREHRGMGAAWADYDGDGRLDLLVTAWGENVLWRNRGDGSFEDVTASAGMEGEGFWTGAAFADIDRDGDLDLHVCGYVRYDEQDSETTRTAQGDAEFPFTLNPSSWPPHENRLYVNQGDGTFRDRAEAAGVLGEAGRSLSGVWADFDDDGWPDLYVANDVSDNALHLNQGDGTFRNASYEAVVADYRGAMGIAVGDWDADLDLDLFITHWIAQENALYSSLARDLAEEDGPGGLMFVDDADRVGLGQIALDLIGWGTSFVDLDADGREDLFVANGSTFQQRDDPTRLVPMHPHLYWNRGAEEGFFEVGESAGIRTDPPGVGRGAAFCDYDDDGDLDLAICRHGGKVRLLRNDTRGGHSVHVRLRATSGHAAALGSKVTVHAGDAALLRVAGSEPSYLSSSARDLHVGLGDATRIDSVVVRWPGASREVFRNLDVDRTWVLEEAGEAHSVPFRSGDRRLRNLGPGGSDPVAMSRDETRRFWALKREANGLLVRGEWGAATTVLEEMLDLDPRHLDSLYGLGNCHLELGRFDDAKSAWSRLIEANAASSRAWLQIGGLHAMPEAGALFDLDAAAHAFEKAHELNPEESGPLIRWGEVEVARARLDTAAEILASAYGMNDRAASAFYLGSYVAFRRGDRSTADELLRRTRDSFREEAPVRGVLGEGDTKSADLAALRRGAVERRLFTRCLDVLRESEPSLPLEKALSCVDRVLSDLPPRPGSPAGN